MNGNDRFEGVTLAKNIGVDAAVGIVAEIDSRPRPIGEHELGRSDLRTQATALGIPYRESLAGWHPSAEFIERIPIGFARQHTILGFSTESGTLEVALASTDAWPQLDVVARFLRRPVKPLLAPSEQVLAAINFAYQQRTGQTRALIASLDQRDVLAEIQQLSSREDLLDDSDRAPVVKLVNLILFEAVKGGASDVHIQADESQMMMRLRIDGILFDAFSVPKDLQDEVVSRIKVMARMNIAEKRLPQDGRATVQVGDRLIDLRVASLPTSHGERVVIRLLDKSARIYTLDELGMESATLNRFAELIGLEHGLILVTGPTGSGKSTTLYAALQRINAKDLNVLTLEDPIEYELQGISQTQVTDKKGMTFASGLRSVLRQDPDIIMVGEIRDRETAVMAIQSALTGHMVFSTLHTNDAASAVTRLLDLGIEPYLVASSVVAILAQRLVRRVCPEVRRPIELLDAEWARLGVEPAVARQGIVRRGSGCDGCRQTGYRGRIGIFELLTIDDQVRHEIQAQANASQIRGAAVARGMRSMRDDGVAKILAGATTVEEVIRVTMRTSL